MRRVATAVATMLTASTTETNRYTQTKPLSIFPPEVRRYPRAKFTRTPGRNLRQLSGGVWCGRPGQKGQPRGTGPGRRLAYAPPMRKIILCGVLAAATVLIGCSTSEKAEPAQKTTKASTALELNAKQRVAACAPVFFYKDDPGNLLAEEGNVEHDVANRRVAGIVRGLGKVPGDEARQLRADILGAANPGAIQGAVDAAVSWCEELGYTDQELYDQANGG